MSKQSLILAAAASTYSVSVDDLKKHLNIESSAYDALLPYYSQAAENQAEHLTGRAITPQSWLLVMDEFPCDSGFIELPRPPVSSTDAAISLKYIASSGATLTFSSASYTVDTAFEPCRIYLRRDSSGDYGEWPETLDVENAINITYVTGYTTVPEPIKHWIKMRVGQMLEYREPIVSGEQTQNLRRDYVDGLLDRYRVYQKDEL